MNIVDFLFPKQCIFCSRVGYDICPNCLRGLVSTLPTCCICKKINNNYWTHRECLNPPIQCFTGWYISKELRKSLRRKESVGIYSPHSFLLEILIKRLGIEKTLDRYSVREIASEDVITKRVNRNLAKELRRNNPNKKNYLYIGEYIDKECDIKKLIKRLPKGEPFTCKIVCLFDTTQSRDLCRVH